MTWKEVDKGWGDQAHVWAAIMEPRWWPEFDAVLRATQVGPGTNYLDIACGSGLMLNMAARRGAHANGWYLRPTWIHSDHQKIWQLEVVATCSYRG